MIAKRLHPLTQSRTRLISLVFFLSLCLGQIVPFLLLNHDHHEHGAHEVQSVSFQHCSNSEDDEHHHHFVSDYLTDTCLCQRQLSYTLGFFVGTPTTPSIYQAGIKTELILRRSEKPPKVESSIFISISRRGPPSLG